MAHLAEPNQGGSSLEEDTDRRIIRQKMEFDALLD
jgi:hypothetical protein